MTELPHRCGAVQEYCVHENIRIVFCSICRKVLGQMPVTPITVVTQVIVTDVKERKKYDEKNLEKWV